MDLVADILLVAGALGAGFYCFVLSRRLNRFNDLEKGVGGAVAVLSSQVDDLSKTLVAAQGVSHGSTAALDDLTKRAESVATRLELMMASFHDVPTDKTQTPQAQQEEQIKPAELRKSPTGPMFVRHDRAQTGMTQ